MLFRTSNGHRIMIPLSIYRARCDAYVLCTRPFRSKEVKKKQFIVARIKHTNQLESKWNIFYLYTLAECENIERRRQPFGSFIDFTSLLSGCKIAIRFAQPHSFFVDVELTFYLLNWNDALFIQLYGFNSIWFGWWISCWFYLFFFFACFVLFFFICLFFYSTWACFAF